MKLSSILSDGMVLQRNREIIISGQTTPDYPVSLAFCEKVYNTIADKNGNWSITLGPLDPGGAYQMEINADEQRIISNILVGDVWLLGGQSNMQLPLSRTLDLFAEEVKTMNNPHIRQFNVPQSYSFHEPQLDVVGGSWISANQPDVLSFSAAGYFFAKEIYETQGVPIGLIQTAVGGTPIEAWLSEKTLRQLGGYEAELELHKNDSFVQETQQQEMEQQALWYEHLHAADSGLQEEWYKTSYDDSKWSTMALPNSWKGSELEGMRGSVWFRKEIELPSAMLTGEAKLMLGTIIDADDTYINGELVGSTGYQYPPRRYMIPEGILKPGKNTLAVRVISTQNTGSFVKDMPYKLISNGQELDLQGQWKYKIGTKTKALASSTFFQYKPTGVYNDMIAPLLNYDIKGFLWYQGESNTGQPTGYASLFQALVSSWRENWQEEELPFIYTQLANLDAGEANSSNSKWAMLREEQRKGLVIPHTAMAVTIDIGQHNDLHPQDKKTVGERLALCARNIAYGEEIVSSGPLYTGMVRIGNSIQLSFDHVGSGLTAQDGQLKQFMISGADGQFVAAKATIHDDKVIVSNEHIKEPLHVRYAWSDNPEGANLYNKEGLPASPFTTEEGNAER